MPSPPPIPPTFTSKKSAILSSLSVPSDTYTDLSPKGTIDSAIKDLITRINNTDGLVTTSSCAGRVSVFLEGRKGEKGKDDGDKEGAQAAVPGGKGLGGRWLFVSHEPAEAEEYGGCVSKMLGLEPTNCVLASISDRKLSEVRLARFQFEPMILHIMAASLHHAQPVLAAAINAGFRESGVQSLKNLDDPNSFPMVAIRSSGLALESVVGVSIDKIEKNDKLKQKGYESNKTVDSVVSEEYLELLMKLASARFDTNTERMQRFEENLVSKEATLEREWEDSRDRRERMRVEGLMKQHSLREAAMELSRSGATQSNQAEHRNHTNDTLLGSLLMS